MLKYAETWNPALKFCWNINPKPLKLNFGCHTSNKIAYVVCDVIFWFFIDYWIAWFIYSFVHSSIFLSIYSFICHSYICWLIDELILKTVWLIDFFDWLYDEDQYVLFTQRQQLVRWLEFCVKTGSEARSSQLTLSTYFSASPVSLSFTESLRTSRLDLCVWASSSMSCANMISGSMSSTSRNKLISSLQNTHLHVF